jgi:hypothetical protein
VSLVDAFTVNPKEASELEAKDCTDANCSSKATMNMKILVSVDNM